MKCRNGRSRFVYYPFLASDKEGKVLSVYCGGDVDYKPIIFSDGFIYELPVTSSEHSKTVYRGGKEHPDIHDCGIFKFPDSGYLMLIDSLIRIFSDSEGVYIEMGFVGEVIGEDDGIPIFDGDAYMTQDDWLDRYFDILNNLKTEMKKYNVPTFQFQYTPIELLGDLYLMHYRLDSNILHLNDALICYALQSAVNRKLRIYSDAKSPFFWSDGQPDLLIEGCLKLKLNWCLKIHQENQDSQIKKNPDYGKELAFTLNWLNSLYREKTIIDSEKKELEQETTGDVLAETKVNLLDDIDILEEEFKDYILKILKSKNISVESELKSHHFLRYDKKKKKNVILKRYDKKKRKNSQVTYYDIARSKERYEAGLADYVQKVDAILLDYLGWGYFMRMVEEKLKKEEAEIYDMIDRIRRYRNLQRHLGNFDKERTTLYDKKIKTEVDIVRAFFLKI